MRSTPSVPGLPALVFAALLAVNAWAQRVFAEALARAPEALAYVEGRGLSPEFETADWGEIRKASYEGRGG